MASLHIALLQMAGVADPQANLITAERLCRQAAAAGADVALFPELWNVGYHFPPADDAAARRAWEALAVGPDDEYPRHFRALARELRLALAVTYLERTPAGPRNTVAVVDRQGVVRLEYSKVHTCVFGAEIVLTPGDSFAVATLDTAAGPVQVGCMICYDREFPETARLLMLGGAELLLVPNCCDLELNRLTQIRARAYENMLAIAVANHARPRTNGHSVVYDGMAFGADEGSRDMLLVEAGGEEGVYLATLDLDALRAYRAREPWGDAYRKPELYGPLAAREPR